MLLSSQRILISKSLNKQTSLYIYELLSSFKHLNVLVLASKFTSYRESNLGTGVRVLKVCLSLHCVTGCATLTRDLNLSGLSYSLWIKERMGCVKFSSISYYSGSLWNSIPMGKILIFLTLCSSFPFSLFPSFISFLLTCSRGWRRQIQVEMISSVRCWLLPNSVILGKPLNLSET